MARWNVFQWGDGSQAGKDLWNIGCPEHEATIAHDLPRGAALEMADCHNADVERLSAERDAALAEVERLWYGCHQYDPPFEFDDPSHEDCWPPVMPLGYYRSKLGRGG